VTKAEVKSRMVSVIAHQDDGKLVLKVENQTVDVLSADGKDVDAAKLEAALRVHTRGDDRKTEVLLDARGVTWGMVITIQDAARAAGAHTVHHLVRKK
jgi:biopolymer transport protein ExbD